MSWDLLRPPSPPPPPDPAPRRPVKVRPGQRPPQVDPATEYLLLSGRGRFEFGSLRGQQGNPLIIRAENVLTNRAGEACGLLLKDGCADLRVEGVKATACGHGIRLRGVERVTLAGCETWENLIEGVILGAAKSCTIEDCRSWRNGQGPATTAPEAASLIAELVTAENLRRESFGAEPVGDEWTSDKRHGFYAGYHGEGNTFLRCVAADNTGLGCHLNGTADERGLPERNVTLRSCVLRRNGSHGSGNIDANYLSGLLVEDCLIADGRGGFSTWDDGAGDARKGAKGIILRRSTVLNDRWVLRLEAGGMVRVEASIVGGPVSVDRTSRITWDDVTKHGPAAQARAEWLDADLRSRVPGVGYQAS